MKTVKETTKPVQEGYMTQKLMAQFIRAKRTGLRIRVQDAAELCGVSLATYVKLEKGEAPVRTDTLFKVATTLGVKIIIEDWDADDV